MAVPIFETTMPAAMLAKMAAFSREEPEARAAVRAATTVSPAPETSKTSLAKVGITLMFWPFSQMIMPSWPMVMTM